MLKLGIPQILYLALILMGLGVHLAKDGQPRTDKYSFWGQLFITIITVYILYKGGFF